MKSLIQSVLILATACAHAAPPVPATVSAKKTMTIERADSRVSTSGPEANFTGSVRVTPLFQPTETTRASGAYVSFKPGARSAWHTHPNGQTLVVTEGTGRIQQWGGAVQQINKGDVIWTPPGVKHWHGAAPATAMTHLALQEKLEGAVVEWMEKVSDEDYLAPVHVDSK
jgi:quercetin dioxygenase-like cupin family protein